MKIKELQYYSHGYQLLRYFVSFYFRIFYKKVQITGMENVPNDCPIIFAPNHQNALMDALAIVCTIKKQPVFLARSDIFKNPVVAVVLRFLRMLPVFRMRDGFEQLRENDEVFDRVIAVLRNKGAIGIMPEGNHGDKKMLRPLKKGILRIVFQAEQGSEFNLNLKIVPVGIEFDNYTSFRSKIFINFGKPIDFKHLFADYRDNPQLALNKAKDFLADHLRLYMIDIRNEENYSLFLNLWKIAGEKFENILENSGKKFSNHFYGGKKLSEVINRLHNTDSEFLKSLGGKVEKYSGKLHQNGLKISSVSKFPKNKLKLGSKFLGLVLLLPVWIYSLITSSVPWLVIRSVTSSIEDAQFISSFKFVLSLVLFPLFYLLQFFIFLFVAGFFPALIFLITLPFAGFIAWAYLKWWKKLLNEFSFSKVYNSGKLTEALLIRDEILNELKTVLPDLETVTP